MAAVIELDKEKTPERVEVVAMRISMVFLVVVFFALPTATFGDTNPIVDVYRGPVVASPRIIGLGGAYTSIGEGTSGCLLTPVSFAARYSYSTSWFDYDYALDYLRVLQVDRLDMDNDGSARNLTSAYWAFNIGLGLFFGDLGVGLWGTIDEYRLEQYKFSFQKTILGAGLSLLDEQLVVALGTVVGTFELTYTPPTSAQQQNRGEEEKSRFTNQGLTFGVLWRPNYRQYRAGLSLQTGIDLQPRQEQTNLDRTQSQSHGSSHPFPKQVVIPWQLAIGFSYMWSKERPYNATRKRFSYLLDTEETKIARIDRRYVLLSADLVFWGRSKDGAISCSSFAAGGNAPSGKAISFSPRIGLESEVVDNLLTIRGGTYIEPARIMGARPRMHITAGGDWNIGRFLWWQWRLTLAVDFARQYSNSGISLGFWH